MQKKYQTLIINGPNLGNLGERQPEIYGTDRMTLLPELLDRVMGVEARLVNTTIEQYNSEGCILDRLEQAKKDNIDGVVINAGAYTHTSLALADCLAWIGLPTVEVHLSNIMSRQEEIRHKSLIAPHTIGLIAGFGLLGYALGIRALFEYLEKNKI